MNCPYCDEELSLHDYYGIPNGFNHMHKETTLKKIGDIYKCENDECEGHLFYTDANGELHEGHPC